MVEPSPILDPCDQVAYLRDEKGVTFDLISESDAAVYLSTSSYFYKTKAYAKNFEKYLNQRGFYNAADANIYAQYNSMFGPGMGYGQPMYQGMGMYGQQPMGQPQGYYQQQPAPAAPAMPADPNTNPMQAPYGAPYYNPQFGNQANIMMQGTYYQQPYQPPMAPQPAMPQQGQQPPYNPVYGTAPQGQPQQNAQQAPAQQAQPQQTQTTTTKVDL